MYPNLYNPDMMIKIQCKTKNCVLNNGYEPQIASIVSKPSGHQKHVDYIEEAENVKDKVCISWDTKQQFKAHKGL